MNPLNFLKIFTSQRNCDESLIFYPHIIMGESEFSRAIFVIDDTAWNVAR